MINLFISNTNPEPIKVKNPKAIKLIYIDLFCGAGGTTTGILKSKLNNEQCAIVAACVNHDHRAIKSHWMNHPEVVHFEEDIRTLQLNPLVELVSKYRNLYPHAKIVLWASLECTNFSKAKGGQPRDADSRTLANHLYRYIRSLNPDYIQIENVVEFMAWGPMRVVRKKLHKRDVSKGVYENSELKYIFNKKTQKEELAFTPISKKNGTDFRRWENHINSFGYRSEWKQLNSADFGAYTSRNRLFGIFAKPNLPIAWPEPTHAKKVEQNNLFGAGLKPHKAVKDVLDFKDEGKSIFNRKKPLVDPSLERIYAGLIKFVAGGKEAFMIKWNSMSKNGKYTAPNVDDPCPTVSTQNRLGIAFIAKYYSGKPANKVIPVTAPAGTITSIDGQSLVTCKPFVLNTNFNNVGSSIESPAPTLVASRRHPYIVNPVFLAKYYGNGENISSIDEPAGALVTKDRFSKIQPVFLDKTFTGNYSIQSIENPAGTIMPNDKHTLINCQPFILNPSHGGHCSGTDVPCVTIIARQDKSPLYLIQFEFNRNIRIPIYEDDTDMMIKIKEFMALYGLADIKMRMLKISELLPIQGFPIDYKLFGNQTDQKKFIGNSVETNVAMKLTERIAQLL